MQHPQARGVCLGRLDFSAGHHGAGDVHELVEAVVLPAVVGGPCEGGDAAGDPAALRDTSKNTPLLFTSALIAARTVTLR